MLSHYYTKLNQMQIKVLLPLHILNPDATGETLLNPTKKLLFSGSNKSIFVLGLYLKNPVTNTLNV